MWLQKLILLGTVVCSISAPIDPPGPVLEPRKYVNAIIKEALSLLNHSNDTDAVTVSEGEGAGCTWATLLAWTGLDRQ